MNYLITGANGFTGKTLLEELLKDPRNKVFAHSVKWGNSEKKLYKNVSFLECDIKDENKLRSLLSDLKLDGVFHLAAQASVKKSWDDPVSTYEVNVIGTAVLISVLKLLNPLPKLLFVSSSEVYGSIKNDKICSEEGEISACNPYGLSKIAAEQACSLLYPSYCIVRPFTIIGRGQSETYVIPSFCRQIQLMKQRKQKFVLYTGNIKARRYFTDIRDIVKAYLLVMEKGNNREIYNISSEKSFSIKQIILGLKKISNIDFKTEVDPLKLRLKEPNPLKISLGKIKTLGWKPSVPLKVSLSEMLSEYKV